jgi:hypothetical protein
MWGNALAKKWGSTDTVTLHDGLGQGNNIAVFPTYVQGICAQLDLWRSSANYKNKKFSDAIAIWSGHNNVESYIKYVLQRIVGMTRDTVMNDVFWQSPMGVEFLKAQAGHEAGKIYPAPDEDWVKAQAIVMSGNHVAVEDNPTPLIRIGDGGDAVSKMQKALSCVETGRYLANSETEFALRLFQVRKGLAPDGICGVMTWDKLIPPTW